jgi:AraC-like DNA-binding protein
MNTQDYELRHHKYIVKRVVLSSIEDLQRPVRGMVTEHVQLGLGPLSGEILSLDLGASFLNFGEYHAPLRTANGSFSEKTATLFFPLLDKPENLMNGFEMAREKTLVFPEGCDYSFRMQGKMTWLVIEVAHDEIYKYAGVFDRLEIDPIGPHAQALSLNPRVQAKLRRAISDTLPTLHRNPDYFADEHNQKIVHERFMEVVSAAFLSLDYSAVSISDPKRISTLRIFKRGEEYIASKLSSKITIADICCATNTSRRSLFRAFQEHIGLSPYEYLIKRRLTDARRILARSSMNDTSVTTIAIDCGFAHFGRFSARYKKLFGENPCDTLRRG